MSLWTADTVLASHWIRNLPTRVRTAEISANVSHGRFQIHRSILGVYFYPSIVPSCALIPSPVLAMVRELARFDLHRAGATPFCLLSSFGVLNQYSQSVG